MTVKMAGQVISIIAMILNISSFQCKRNRNLFIVMGFGSLLFSVSFMMIKAYPSAVYNIINLIATCLVVKKSFQTKKYFILISILYIIGAIFTYDSLWSFVPMLAQILATYGMWFGDGAFIRKLRLFIVSPVWLINNTVFAFNIGGIICEAFMMVSTIVSFVRYRKTGFER